MFDCMKSLAFPGMGSSSHVDSPADGTCQWVASHEAFHRWENGQGLLFIEGKPGAGKSTLLKRLIGLSEGNPEHGLTLSFFFHDRGKDLQKTPLGLYRSLAHQIIQKAPKAAASLVEAFEKRCAEEGEPGDKWEWEEESLQGFIESALLQAVKTVPAWLFIDALDESGSKDNATNVFNWIVRLSNGLQRAGASKCRICVSCRHYPNLGSLCELRICVENENARDIATYVGNRFSQFPAFSKTGIPDMITVRAAGMFVWARLVTDKVLQYSPLANSAGSVEQLIAEVPQDIDKLYRDIIDGEMAKDSLKLMRCLCAATRPLSLDELRWAMLVDGDDYTRKSARQFMDSKLYTSDNHALAHEVTALSCGLAEVTILQSDGDEAVSPANGDNDVDPFDFADLDFHRGPIPGTPVVQLIHQTVKDFLHHGGLFDLEKKFGMVGPADERCVATDEVNGDELVDEAIGRAHMQMLGTCVHYLALNEIGMSELSPLEELEAFPLLRYAASSWDVHLDQCQVADLPDQDIMRLFGKSSKDPTEMWGGRFAAEDVPPHYVPEGLMVHACARLGTYDELSEVIETYPYNVVCDTEDLSGMTPFSTAIYGDHYDVADLLFSTGNVEGMPPDDANPPLYQAILMGNFRLVKRLLKKDNSGAGLILPRGQTLLDHAMYTMQENTAYTVKLLLQTGRIDVNHKDEDGCTPLIHASSRGKIGVVRELLNAHASIDLPDNKGRTALSHAAESGKKGMVWVLLSAGASVDLRDGDGRTALAHAASSGSKDVVKVLLDAGAYIDAQDVNGQTPASLAEAKGYRKVVHLLQYASQVRSAPPEPANAAAVPPQPPVQERLSADGGFFAAAPGQHGLFTAAEQGLLTEPGQGWFTAASEQQGFFNAAPVQQGLPTTEPGQQALFNNAAPVQQHNFPALPLRQQQSFSLPVRQGNSNPGTFERGILNPRPVQRQEFSNPGPVQPGFPDNRPLQQEIPETRSAPPAAGSALPLPSQYFAPGHNGIAPTQQRVQLGP